MLRDCQIKEIKFLLDDEVTVKIYSKIGNDESYIALNAVETNEEWHMFDVREYYESKNFSRKELREVIENDVKNLRQEIFLNCGYTPEFEIQEK